MIGRREDLDLYFDTVILRYNCGDMEAFLSYRPFNSQTQGPATGLLLSCVMGGIDTMGGMLFGFEKGSGRRTVAFMKEHMDIPEKVGEVLYDFARCGMFHESSPKSGIGIRSDWIEDGALFHSSAGDNTPHLNVVELARKYLRAIEKINRDRRFLTHLPELPDDPIPAEVRAMTQPYPGGIFGQGTTTAPTTTAPHL